MLLLLTQGNLISAIKIASSCGCSKTWSPHPWPASSQPRGLLGGFTKCFQLGRNFSTCLCWVRTVSPFSTNSSFYRNPFHSATFQVFCLSQLARVFYFASHINSVIKWILGLKALRHSNLDAGKVLKAQLNTIDLILEF